MPEYGRDIVEKVCSSVDIVQVIGEHVRLEKRGKSFFGLCPFHSEKTASFSVSQEKQMYYCFGCQAGGNVLSFVMDHNKQTFPEALEVLAERTGIVLPTLHSDAGEVLARRQAREKDIKIMEWAADWYHRQLSNPAIGREARDYLTKRGVTTELATSLRLGYSLPGWNTLVDKALSDRIAEADLVRLGLAAQGEKSLYDRFRNRLMFPIRNRQGQVIAFGGRLIVEDKDNPAPKYLNSPETPLFVKSRELYGLDRAAKAITQLGFAVVVEGYMDAITPWQYGIDNVVATLGTALSPEHGQVLRRYTGQVSLCFDSDSAGQNATLRGLEVLGGKELAVRVAKLGDCKDPDAFLRKYGRDKFISAVGDEALTAIEYRIWRLSLQHNRGTPSGLGAFGAQTAKIISTVSNALERDAYVERIIQKYNLPEAAFRAEMAKIIDPKAALRDGSLRTPSETKREPKTVQGWVKAARILLYIMAKFPPARAELLAVWSRLGFVDEKYRHLAIWMTRELTPDADPLYMAHELAPELKSELAAALTGDILEENVLGVANECFVKIEQHILATQIDAIKNSFTAAEGDARVALAEQLAALQRRKKAPQREKLSQLRGYTS